MSYSSAEGFPTQYNVVNEADHKGHMQERVHLTPEEQRVLKQCAQEGIINRAIPMGIAFGASALVAARSGFLNHPRWGAKPSVIGFGLLGYFIGRFSYSKICFQRALAVPDGNLRKLFPHLVDPSLREAIESNENFYTEVETSTTDADQSWKPQSYSTDIELPTTSAYDTLPSGDYYNSTTNPSNEAPRSYTSYDDLRRDNRQEYIQKMYPEQSRSVPRPAPPAPTREPNVPRRSEPVEPTQKTKYGDAWG